MKTNLALFLAIIGLAIGLAHAQSEEYKLSIRVFTPLDETHPSFNTEPVGIKNAVIYSVSNIELALDEKKEVTLKSDHRGSKDHQYDDKATESCEILLTQEPEGKFQIACEWIIADKKGNSAATHRQIYTKTLSLDEWGFTPKALGDTQETKRHLGFLLTK